MKKLIFTLIFVVLTTLQILQSQSIALFDSAMLLNSRDCLAMCNTVSTYTVIIRDIQSLRDLKYNCDSFFNSLEKQFGRIMVLSETMSSCANSGDTMYSSYNKYRGIVPRKNLLAINTFYPAGLLFLKTKEGKVNECLTTISLDSLPFCNIQIGNFIFRPFDDEKYNQLFEPVNNSIGQDSIKGINLKYKFINPGKNIEIVLGQTRMLQENKLDPKYTSNPFGKAKYILIDTVFLFSTGASEAQSLTISTPNYYTYIVPDSTFARSIKKLRINSGYNARFPYDIYYFPNLESLKLNCIGDAEGAFRFASLPKLKELELYRLANLSDNELNGLLEQDWSGIKKLKATYIPSKEYFIRFIQKFTSLDTFVTDIYTLTMLSQNNEGLLQHRLNRKIRKLLKKSVICVSDCYITSPEFNYCLHEQNYSYREHYKYEDMAINEYVSVIPEMVDGRPIATVWKTVENNRTNPSYEDWYNDYLSKLTEYYGHNNITIYLIP